LYEFCLDQTADYTEEIETKLAKSLYGSVLIYIFDNPEILLELDNGKRSSFSMQAAIFNHLDSIIIPKLFQDVLKEQWQDKEVYVWLPPTEIKRITDQHALQEYNNIKHALPELHQDDFALKKDLKLFAKVFKKLKPKDQKFLLMMAEPIMHKGKQFPQIIADVCNKFGITEENARQRKSLLIKRLKSYLEKEKKKN